MNRWLIVLATMFAVGLAPLAAEEMSPEAPAVESSGGLSAEIKIGTGLENKEATGVADTLPADTVQLVGSTRISGANEPTQITHVWKFNGEDAGSVPLNVKSSPFRTFSRKTVIGSGTYSLEVQDANGKAIASKEVQIQAPVQ